MCTEGKKTAEWQIVILKLLTIYDWYTGGHAVAYLYRTNICILIFTPEHSNRPHNPMGMVFWSTSNRSILSQLCTILTIGKTNQKKKKGIKHSPQFCVTLTEVKPPLSGAAKVLEPSQDKSLCRLCLCLAKRQIKPQWFQTWVSSAAVHLWALLYKISATNPTSALRFSTCLPRWLCPMPMPSIFRHRTHRGCWYSPRPGWEKYPLVHVSDGLSISGEDRPGPQMQFKDFLWLGRATDR